MIALCCHQLCTFNSYVNQQYLVEMGICKRDFAILATISTWALCGDGIDGTLHWSGLPYAKRQQLGFKCKRILDVGRLMYLQSLGANCKLVNYVNHSISMENVALIGNWDQGI